MPALLDRLSVLLSFHDRGTWDVFVRRLRDAGDIPRTKRGLGAEHVKPQELATLVLAGLLTHSPAQASEMVRRVRAQQSVSEAPEMKSRLLHDACNAGTFGEAFDTLMTNGVALKAEQAALAESDEDAMFVVVVGEDMSRLTVSVPKQDVSVVWGAYPFREERGWDRNYTLYHELIFTLAALVHDGAQ